MESKLMCPKCGTETFIVKRVEKHVGAYCSDCGRWLQWLPTNELINNTEFASAAQSNYAYSLMEQSLGKPLTIAQAGGIIKLLKG